MIEDLQKDTRETISIKIPTLVKNGETHTTSNGIESRHTISGMFNTTRVQFSNGPELLLGRVLKEKSFEHRGIDMSALWALGADGESYEFNPHAPEGISNVEDPRYSHGILGVTAVYSHIAGEPIRFSPGIIHVAMEDGKLVAKDMQVLKNPDGSHLQARNITPLVVDGEKVTFLARIEDGKHDHTLSLFESEGSIAHLKGEIDIPITEWNDKKVGTTGNFLQEVKSGISWLLLHGQHTTEAVADTRNYTLGVIEITDDGEITRITQKPILTRDDVVPLNEELHTENKVVYATDNPVIKDGKVNFLVNVGDIDTTEVSIPVDFIDRQLVSVEQLPQAA